MVLVQTYELAVLWVVVLASGRQGRCNSSEERHYLAGGPLSLHKKKAQSPKRSQCKQERKKKINICATVFGIYTYKYITHTHTHARTHTYIHTHAHLHAADPNTQSLRRGGLALLNVTLALLRAHLLRVGPCSHLDIKNAGEPVPTFTMKGGQ